ncbi:hypothetical protein EI94DRAFT_1321219 [Lactarius quietus]|nr:hypothetical protein EI94DRAFT_1321219 [Lactarius quietus]
MKTPAKLQAAWSCPSSSLSSRHGCLLYSNPHSHPASPHTHLHWHVHDAAHSNPPEHCCAANSAANSVMESHLVKV